MLNKIYSLLASFLVLTACTTDDFGKDKNQTDDSKVAVSFQTDVPSAEAITKSSSVPTDEKGVTNLKLITFNSSGQYIETVQANSVSEGTYSASISKETRRVQFVANYDGYASIKTPTDVITAATNEYVFYAEQKLGEGFTSVKDVVLLRNWSKISLADKSGKLTNIQFMVYNASTKATVSPGSEVVNLPSSGNTFSKDPKFVDAAQTVYTFEQKTSGDHSAFVIVKAKFDNSKEDTYYKIDLSVTNPQTGIVTNYDIMRNYWYKITISNVQRQGVSWSEVIKPGKIADNNITASAELDKYPSISFGNEKLEVTKTTFVFTKASGNVLDMLATYTKDNKEDYDGLSLVQKTEETSDVLNGVVKISKEGNSGRLQATINNPSTDEKRGYFYIKGGNLQRKITLVVRKPYTFTDVNFYNSSDVNAAYLDETTNQITSGPDESIWLGFTIPSVVDESIFPLECKIKSTTLYAVTDGVRIETDPADDKVYYYVYTAKEAGRHKVEFKTNATVLGETVNLTAEYFAGNSAKYKTIDPKVVSGTIKFATKKGTNQGTSYYIPDKSTVSYMVDGVTRSFTVGSNGKYTLTIPPETPEGATVSFSYTDSENKVYAYDTTVGALAGKTITLICNVTEISGVAYYGSSSPIKRGTVKYIVGGISGSFTTDKSGYYDIELPTDISDDAVIRFTYTYNNYEYLLEMTVGSLKSNTKIVLRRG